MGNHLDLWLRTCNTLATSSLSLSIIKHKLACLARALPTLAAQFGLYHGMPLRLGEFPREFAPMFPRRPLISDVSSTLEETQTSTWCP